MIVVVVIAVGVGVVAGSGGDSSGDEAASDAESSLLGPEGTLTVPESENPLKPEQLWDPKSLPDSIFGDIGFDRAVTEKCDLLFGVKSCQWGTPPTSASGYAGYVLSARYPLDEVSKQPKYTDFSDTRVDGLRAVKYTAVRRGFVERCDIAWGTSYGSVAVTITRRSSVSGPLDNCGLAAKWAALVHAHAPK